MKRAAVLGAFVLAGCNVDGAFEDFCRNNPTHPQCVEGGSAGGATAGGATAGGATAGGATAGGATAGGSTAGGATAGGATAGGGTAGGAAGGLAGGSAGGSSGGTAGGALVSSFSVDPDPIFFGGVPQNTSTELTVTITNTGQTQLSRPMQSSDNLNIFFPTNECVGPLDVDAGCTFKVRFSPLSQMPYMATITVSAAPAAPSNITAAGTGTAPGISYNATPSSGDFPDTLLPQTATLRVDFSNTGMSTLNLSPSQVLDAVGPVDFTLMTDGCNGAAVGPDAGCFVVVLFAPQTEGLHDGTLRLRPAPNPDLVVPLQGLGYGLSTLTVVMSGLSDAGRVVSSDGGIDCPGRCQHTSRRNDTQALTALPAPGPVAFAGWDGGGCALSPFCTVSMTADASVVSARYDPYNRVFITSSSSPGSALGASGDPVAAANQLCDQAVTGAGLRRPGQTWLALLNNSADASVAVSKVPPESGGWVRLDGAPFASTTADLFSGRVYQPITFTEAGLRSTNNLAWTGMLSDGGVGADCQRWTDAGAQGVGGQVFAEGTSWFSEGPINCSLARKLLCLETGGFAPVGPPSPRPPGSRLAFLSAGSVGNDGGDADALCNAEAGVASGYLALRMPDAGFAHQRFRLDAGTWYRTDGVKLYVTAAEMAVVATSSMLAPLNRQFDGGVVASGLVWTGGAPTQASSPASSCSDWSSTAGTGAAGEARVGGTAGTFTGAAISCAQALRVYCFEN